MKLTAPVSVFLVLTGLTAAKPTTLLLELANVKSFSIGKSEVKPLPRKAERSDLATAEPSHTTLKPTPHKLPAFRHGLDCPDFNITRKNENYEVREYMPTSWISTSTIGTFFWPSAERMFKRLFSFINGHNSENGKYSMTLPVSIQVKPGKAPYVNVFTMHFFLKDPTNLPKPFDSRVILVKFPKQCYYVRSFGGNIDSYEQYQWELEKLIASVGVNETFVRDRWIINQYNNPDDDSDTKHNEVILLAN